MRNLNNDDFYLISEIADCMDLEFPPSTRIVNGKEVPKTQEEYGREIFAMLFKKAHKAKKPINQLLANLMGKDVQDIEKMPFKETLSLVRELFAKEGFVDFLK
jgi:hypothetical protein